MKNNIKNARERKGYTQQECADILGITLRAWQGYEQGIREPKFEYLCKIADMLDVTTDYLLCRNPSQSNTSIDTDKIKIHLKSIVEHVNAIIDDTDKLIH